VILWRALLIIYPELDFRRPGRRWRKGRVRHRATEQEITDATVSFHAFPQLVAELTFGEVRVVERSVMIDSPLRSLTREHGKFYWPSPKDTRRELDRLAPRGSCDSVFVFWPQHDSNSGSAVPCRGWGLGMGAEAGTNGATYAVVSNVPSQAWQGEAPGEVWLHEWLHGVCRHFAGKGYPMPDRDADGAEIHGYVRSPTRGWTQYYCDLMNGRVAENGKMVGIPSGAWAIETPSRTGLV
jgi:hypothetical protein